MRMFERSLTILYGSQTGTAQDLAEQIWRESKLYHFVGCVLPMDTYDINKLINEQIVIFICSTTGQGDEPDNMKKFWKFLLRRNLPLDSLNGVKFACLGLGDSSYVKYNFVAKRLQKRLQQLGGESIVPLGLCDDQHDLGASAVSIPWISSLWKELEELCPLPSGLQKLLVSPKEYRWNVKAIDEDKENNVLTENAYGNIFDECNENGFENAHNVLVVKNIRTTSDTHFQDVRLISFDGENIKWSPGDILIVRPENSTESVDALFQLFNIHNLQIYPETVVSIKEFDSEMPVPEYLKMPLCLKSIATQLWDLNALPRQRFFQLLAINCTNELEKEKLNELTLPEYQDELYKYINRPRRNVLEVLYDFPNATSKLTLQLLFELFQFIKPRSFSIASSSKSGILEILVAVVEYKTILKVLRKGLCSNWLKALKRNDCVRIGIKRGTFKLPSTEETPLIMVGPGTGLAPFRSILLEREFTNEAQTSVLFFGCRNESGDFHCKDDLKRLEQNGLLKLFCAFSRDQEDKSYVQHKIMDQKKLLKNLILDKNGYILVAGNSKNMPQAVKTAIMDVLEKDTLFMDNLVKIGQYQEETWA